MYEGDSFFTLSSGGRLGLLALSAVLAVFLLVFAQWVRRRSASIVVGATSALALFWVFLWLSPQLYYSYYLTIIPGLPWQSVIRSPPGIDTLVALLTFQGRQNLAAHGAGLLGWALLAAGCIDFNLWLKWIRRSA